MLCIRSITFWLLQVLLLKATSELCVLVMILLVQEMLLQLSVSIFRLQGRIILDLIEELLLVLNV